MSLNWFKRGPAPARPARAAGAGDNAAMLELMILAVLGVLGAGVWFLWPVRPDALQESPDDPAAAVDPATPGETPAGTARTSSRRAQPGADRAA